MKKVLFRKSNIGEFMQPLICSDVNVLYPYLYTDELCNLELEEIDINDFLNPESEIIYGYLNNTLDFILENPGGKLYWIKSGTILPEEISSIIEKYEK